MKLIDQMSDPPLRFRQSLVAGPIQEGDKEPGLLLSPDYIATFLSSMHSAFVKPQQTTTIYRRPSSTIAAYGDASPTLDNS